MGSSKTVKLPVLTMKHKEMNNRQLVSAIEKLKAAETDVFTASRLRAVVRVLKPAIILMEDEYLTDIQKPHRDKILEETGIDVSGPIPEGEISDELKGKLKVLDKELGDLQKAFGEQVVEFECIPLGPQHFKDVKISAEELEALGPFFDETGETRTEAFKAKLGVVPNTKGRAK